MQCDTSSSTAEVFLCYKLCDEDNNMIYLRGITDSDSNLILFETNKINNFISLTVLYNQIIFYFNGERKIIENILDYSQCDKVLFGYKKDKLKSIYNYLQGRNSTNFEITNIIIPEDSVMSNDRIDDIYNKIVEIDDITGTTTLNSQNAHSITTTYSSLNDSNKNFDVISFDQSFTSTCGLTPQNNLLLASLNNIDFIKKMFTFDNSKKSYVYGLKGKHLQYEIDSSKYNESSSYSFEYYISNSI